jgi:hypothetical protein
VWAKRVVEHFHDGQRIFDGTHALLLPQKRLMQVPHTFPFTVASRALGPSAAVPVEEQGPVEARQSPHLRDPRYAQCRSQHFLCPVVRGKHCF